MIARRLAALVLVLGAFPAAAVELFAPMPVFAEPVLHLPERGVAVALPRNRDVCRMVAPPAADRFAVLLRNGVTCALKDHLFGYVVVAVDANDGGHRSVDAFAHHVCWTPISGRAPATQSPVAIAGLKTLSCAYADRPGRLVHHTLAVLPRGDDPRTWTTIRLSLVTWPQRFIDYLPQLDALIRAVAIEPP